MLIILHCKQTARETSALRFCFLLFCLINLSSSTKSECNGECKPLGECKAITEMKNPNYRTLQYCNRAERIVCCPTIQINAPSGPKENEHRTFAKECENYRKAVYPNCPVTKLISGGRDAELREFPHMALVGVYKDSQYNWFCGGALISPKYVLTAAHCILVEGGKPNRVRLGELNYNSTTDGANIQEFTIKNFTVYPGYKVRQEYFDIGLLELNGEATLNEDVVPICLPSNNGSRYTEFYAAGWGLKQFASEKASHLQTVKLDKFDDEDCRRSAGRDSFSLPQGLDTSSQFCAGSDKDARDTCQADSGSPLFIEHVYRACMFEVHGITSFGNPVCGTKGSRGIYTRVLPYIDWIESIVWNQAGAN